MLRLTALGTCHAALASAGIAIGLIQLLRRKGDAPHRSIGYIYVGAMLVADMSALWVFQFTGGPNVLHAGAVVNLLCLAAGLRPVLTRPRPIDWLARHRTWMAGSYIGLLAAAAVEATVRTIHFASSARVWGATAVVTLLVTVIARTVLRRSAKTDAA